MTTASTGTGRQHGGPSRSGLGRLVLAVSVAAPLTLCVGAAILVKAFSHLIKQVSEAHQEIW